MIGNSWYVDMLQITILCLQMNRIHKSKYDEEPETQASEGAREQGRSRSKSIFGRKK